MLDRLLLGGARGFGVATVLRALMGVLTLLLAAPAMGATINTFDGELGRVANEQVAPGVFADRYTVTLDGDGELTAEVLPSSEVRLAYVRLYGPDGLTLSFSPAQDTNGARVFVPQKLGKGVYTLSVGGSSAGTGRYQGNLQFKRYAGLPEPAAWLLMVLGFGGLGFTLRGRRKERGRIRFY